jgi:hypothetical protein
VQTVLRKWASTMWMMPRSTQFNTMSLHGPTDQPSYPQKKKGPTQFSGSGR